MVFFLRKPVSWLVAVCERSKNRGCGGGGGCRKGTKPRRAPVLSARKWSILLDYILLGNLLTVRYWFLLDPPFWWPEKPWGCIKKYNETTGKHNNDQRKSYKIPWKTERMLGTNHPERILDTNHDDIVNILKKYSESVGKCDNNKRKWYKKDWKIKKINKILILILKRYIWKY